MNIIETKIQGLYIIEPRVFADERGYFFETFREELFIKQVGNTHFVQDNEAKSNYGVLRGLHFQKGAYKARSFIGKISISLRRMVQSCILTHTNCACPCEIRKAILFHGAFPVEDLGAFLLTAFVNPGRCPGLNNTPRWGFYTLQKPNKQRMCPPC